MNCSLQVEAEGVARRKAEARAQEAEGRAQVHVQEPPIHLDPSPIHVSGHCKKSVSSLAQVGRRLKSALLLTAAFGAAHTALQSELAMECLPM